MITLILNRNAEHISQGYTTVYVHPIIINTNGKLENKRGPIARGGLQSVQINNGECLPNMDHEYPQGIEINPPSVNYSIIKLND